MELYFATSNAGKVADAQNILDGNGITIKQLDVEMLEPCIDSLEQIVAAKVEQAVENSQLYGAHVMADDSGLFVDALNGFPGANTSVFDAKVGKEKLLRLLDEDFSASFKAAIGIYDPKTRDIHRFTGEVKGTLVEPRGSDGFGYDPMFLPDGHEKTFAEDTAYKHEVSHRRKALEKALDWIRDQDEE